MRYLWTILFVIFSYYSLHSQDYKIFSYTTKQGLHSNLIKDVSQDSLGYIWLATDHGLEKFNGIDFEAYNDGLPSLYVKSFTSIRNGKLFVVTDLGIVEMVHEKDTVVFNTFLKGGEIESDSLLFYPKLVYEDSHQGLWISDINSVWFYDEGVLKKYSFPKKSHSINFQRSFSIAESGKGLLYVFSETGFTYLYNEAKDVFLEQKHIPKFSSVDDVKAIDDSRFLIATNIGVYVMDVSSVLPEIELLLTTDACKIEQYNDSVYIIASWKGGVHQCTIKEKKLEVKELNSIQENQINNVYVDKKKKIWLATDDGLRLVQDLPFSSMTTSLNKAFIQSIDFGLDRKTYCIAQHAYVISKISQELVPRIIFKLPNEGNLSQIVASKTDPSVVYIATSNAHLFELKNEKVVRSIDLSSYGRVLFYLMEDARDNLWACLDGCDGVLKISKDFKVEEIDNSQGLTSTAIVLKTDANGDLYCGSFGTSSYLFKYNYDKERFENRCLPLKFEHDERIAVNDISFRDDVIYLATNQGVIQQENENAQRLLIKECTDENATCIVSDNEGYIWFSNKKGLFKYKDGKYYIFTENDGLNTSVGSYRCLKIDDDNRIWFGTPTGLTYSNGTGKIFKTETPILTKLFVDGISHTLHPKDLKIRKQSYLHFEYRSLDMPGDGIEYDFRIIKDNTEIQLEGEGNRLFLPDLKLGIYTLRVRAKQHGNFDWSESSLFSINVVPQWYLTWWAMINYVLSFVLLVLLVTNLYSKRLIAQKQHLEQQVKIRSEEIMQQNEQLKYLNTTKDKFFNIIAHDLKNPFSALLGITKLLKSNFDSLDDETKKEYVHLIYTSSENTYTLLENLLSWASSQTNRIEFNPGWVPLSKVIQSASNVTTLIGESKNIEMVYKVDDDSEVYADFNMLTTVIRNLLMNAIKYSYRDSSIEISAVREVDFVKVFVKDYGTGIDPKRINELFKISEVSSQLGTENEKGTGLGLILCKEFIEKHGGEIGIDSQKGEGSTFWFTLPNP